MVNINNFIDSASNLNDRGVYLITHQNTDLVYVGSTINKFRQRWIVHIRGLISKKQFGNRVLINIANKYGVEGFRFHVLQVMNESSEEEIRNAEAEWIIKYNSYKKGANCSTHTDCAFKGYDKLPLTEEHKLKLREISTTKKQVYAYDKNGNLLHIFDSSVAADKFYNLRKGRVSEKINKGISLKGEIYFSHELKEWSPGKDTLSKRIEGYKKSAATRRANPKNMPEQQKLKIRLNNKKSMKVFLFDLNDNYVMQFNSLNECDDFLNLTRGTTSKVLMHKNGAKTLKRKYIPKLTC